MVKQLRPSADKTRRTILTAARKLFAKRGFSGVSISELSKAAKVNQSLIYHHFGNKEKLWLAVKEEVRRYYKPVRCERCSLKQFLRHILENRSDFFNDHPDLLRILHWQALEPNPDRLLGFAHVIIEEWLTHIKRFQANNEIRKELDPYLVMSLIWSVSDGAHREYPKDLKTIDPKVQKQYLDMAVDGLARMLTP